MIQVKYMKIVTISSKGQITIPMDVQKIMNVTQGSKVMLYPEKNILMVKPLKSSIVAQTAGSLKKYIDPKKLGIPFSKVREETQKIAAAELVKKYG